MVSVPWWYDDPEGWDTCWIGPYQLPGLSFVDVSRGPQIDVRVAPGQTGANLWHMGQPPADVTITTQIWEREHWEALLPILAVLDGSQPKNRKPQAYEIRHPVALARGVAGIVIKSIAGPRAGASPGTREVTFACLEQRAPLKFTPLAPGVKLPSMKNNLTGTTPPSSTPPKP